MDSYIDYQEFITDLISWGDTALEGQGEEWSAREAFWRLFEKAKQGVRNSVFSPFLYIVFGAELTRDEAMLLGAVLSSELRGGEEAFTFRQFQCFFKGGEETFSGSELYYESAPLLFVREIDDKSRKMGIGLTTQIFLFLKSGLLGEQKIPGMDWYYHNGEPLPFLGSSLSRYERMEECIERVDKKKLLYLRGERGSGRKLNYAYLAARMGKSMATVDYSYIQGEGHLRSIQVECLLHHAILVVELPENDETDLSFLWRLLDADDTIFLAGEWEEIPHWEKSNRQYLPYAIETQAVLNDKELFDNLTKAYQWEKEDIRVDFTGRYDFLPGKMRQILELAKAYGLTEGTNCITSGNLRRAILKSGGHSLRKYAKKIQGVYTMDDLVLPDMQKKKLKHICRRVKNRKRVYEEWGFLEKSAYGNGVSMIFAGSPGTGKTMAAQVIAAELGMELYRVELPAIVDKYIGETEKKLNRIFEEAQKSMAILFFDEADVLFSKRTEIRESNDKYSNMEIAFLLQKMEEYDGVSILATNYLQNFDEAFRRRVSDIVDFPMPDAALREKMWKTMLPDRLPVSADIDYAFLAKQFPVTGSVIKNALIYGSFLSAESSTQVLTMEEILKGLGHELEKSGRKLSREDYGEYSHLYETKG